MEKETVRVCGFFFLDFTSLHSRSHPIHSETRIMCPFFWSATCNPNYCYGQHDQKWRLSFMLHRRRKSLLAFERCSVSKWTLSMAMWWLTKRPVYTCLSICKLHIVEYFFRPQVRFFPEFLQPVQEILYNSTELSYKTFFLPIWGNEEIRAWIPGSFTCSYNYFDLF